MFQHPLKSMIFVFCYSLQAPTVPEWRQKLEQAPSMSGLDLMKLNVTYGRFVATQVKGNRSHQVKGNTGYTSTKMPHHGALEMPSPTPFKIINLCALFNLTNTAFVSNLGCLSLKHCSSCLGTHQLNPTSVYSIM